MFEKPNNNKDEKVDDIFADTDTASEKNESSNVVPEKINKISEKDQDKKSEEKIEKFDENKLKQTNNASWLKPVIIGVLIIVLAVVIYFVYGMFSSDEEEIPLIPSSSQEEDDDFTPTSPEFVDPSLIIPEPMEEPEFITEEPEIEEEIIEEEEEIIEVYEINLLDYSFVDTDGDGLSDLAEEFIGTNPNNPDSDGDSFSDYDELINGYNPLGEGMLASNYPAIIYEDNNLSFYYPRNFLIEKINDDSWSLTAIDGAKINIERDITNSANIFDWYQNEFDDYSWIAENRQIINNDMGRAVISYDASMIFLLSEKTNQVFKISFKISQNNDFNYYSELALFINTLIQK